MELQAAMLCDAAHARDGLLSIIGGGLGYVSPPAYPAPLLVTFAALLEVDDRDRGGLHALAVDVVDHQIVRVGGAEGQFEVDGGLDVPETAKFPIVIPLSDITVGASGDYEVRFLIDGNTLAVLPLRAMAV